MIRLPAMLLLAATLLFWGVYDRFEPAGPVLLQSPSLADATRSRGACTETNGRIVLTVAAGAATASINFRMPDASGYDFIRVRGRMKVDDVVEGGNPWRCARLLLIQYDDRNKWIPGHHGVVAESGTRDWELYEDVFEIDPQAAHVDLVIQQTGKSGSAEFDRLVAEPLRVRPSFPWWRIFFAALWTGLAIIYYRHCRLHSRRLRVLILLNGFAILAGALMPERWIEHSAQFAKKEMARIVDQTSSTSHESESTPSPMPHADTEKAIDQFNEMVGGVHGFGHFILFASLCFLVYLSAALEGQHRIFFLKVTLDILLFAGVTEALQHLTMDRTAGIRDMLVDVYGIAAAFGLFLVVYVLCFRRRMAAV